MAAVRLLVFPCRADRWHTPVAPAQKLPVHPHRPRGDRIAESGGVGVMIAGFVDAGWYAFAATRYEMVHKERLNTTLWPVPARGKPRGDRPRAVHFLLICAVLGVPLIGSRRGARGSSRGGNSEETVRLAGDCFRGLGALGVDDSYGDVSITATVGASLFLCHGSNHPDRGR